MSELFNLTSFLDIYSEGTGFIGTNASLAADVNLILQIILAASLTMGILSAMGRNFINHGKAMTVNSILGTLSFLIVMGPSLLFALGYVISNPFDRGVLISIFHALVGSFALASGLFFSVSWRADRSIKPCVGKKKWMKITAISWYLATLSGIIFYLYFFL